MEIVISCFFEAFLAVLYCVFNSIVLNCIPVRYIRILVVDRLLSEDTYLVVSEKVLPEVYRKVILANELLRSGEASSTSEAVKLAGISRSVYYKYRDAVFPYIKKNTNTILTVQVTLLDQPGVLLNLLAFFYEARANILTVNQNIPVKGRAFVSVSARIDRIIESKDSFLEGLGRVEGVIKIDSISD